MKRRTSKRNVREGKNVEFESDVVNEAQERKKKAKH